MRACQMNHVVRKGHTRSSGSAAATVNSPMNNTAGNIVCLAVPACTPLPLPKLRSAHVTQP